MTEQLLTPDLIITAFDAILDYVYGRRWGRDNPHITDKATAQRWIDMGITVPIACVVFHEQMSNMHERWLRDDIKDRSNIPHSLKVFDENIEAAIRQARDGEVGEWEKTDSQWRARVKGWLKNPAFWRAEMWGPPPFQPGCRAPRSVLKEFSKAA